MKKSVSNVNVDVKLTVDSSGESKIQFLVDNQPWTPGYLAYDQSVSYTFTQKLDIPSGTSGGFYAITFGGEDKPEEHETTKRQEVGAALATDVSQIFLDEWWCGNASFSIGGTKSQFIDDICVNVTGQSSSTPDPGKISFTIKNHNSSPVNGAISLRVTFTYTDSDKNNYYLTSRDPEIPLRKRIN